MTARELLQALTRALPPDERPEVPADARALDQPVTGVTHDSRQVAPGAIFVALRGMKADGAAFAGQAVAAGASAVVAEQAPGAPSSVPWIVVTDARLALALLA